MVDGRAGHAHALTELRLAYEMLPADQRAAIALHLHLGYSVAETADIVGAPVETVRSRLRLGRERLRRQLEDASWSAGPADERIDEALRGFLAARAADTAAMPLAGDIVDRIAARTAPRAGRWPILRPGWVAIGIVALLALLGLSVLVAGNRGDAPLRSSSPRNGVIAISANPWQNGSGEHGDIYVAIDGAPARRIIGSDNDRTAQACPRFSPDGTRLAYGEARASGEGSSPPVDNQRGRWPVAERAVVVVELSQDGEASPPVMRATAGPTPGHIACPEWSPDGRYVAFRVEGVLAVADAASGKTTVFRVAETPYGQLGFEWSRDGSRIAVAEPGHIRVVSPGGGPSLVIPVEGETPGSLGWTAGDTRIIYAATDPPGDGQALRVVGADGTGDARLTPLPTDAQLSVTENDAVLSPDGGRLAFVETTRRCTADGCTSDPGASGPWTSTARTWSTC